MQLNTNRKLVNLRRTITPYVGQILILAGVSVYVAYGAQKMSQWGLLWVPAVIWPLFAGYVFIAMKYRVLWDETGLVMRASGGAETCIRYDEISEIKAEMAQVSEFLSQSRPFRRIVVHGRRHIPNALIDISLRHFRLSDIDELLRTIRKHRPDLVVPTIPAGREFL